ncbi:hypothetical protein AOQ84DRAFT_410939 [Glonium stellatum]|uniref:Ubiquitin-like domain-containing protein n=1 Tax=Glonium stellatum TaxID=574774 RepID=A0A8E2EY32_9PEZI|nr:hypothetical protein AOQ84DRAFT_410939 [Glonium stellatum]
MSFGFSVGDFIAVGKLITDIVSCFQSAGGSASGYQELLRELDLLQHALRHLEKLSSKSSSTNIDSIKYAALSCRRPLEHFLGKARKYEKSLGLRTKSGVLRAAADKVEWAFRQKDEIQKLQSYLNVHVGIINLLLAEHGLEKMDLASQKTEEDQHRVYERLENTRSHLKTIKDNCLAQAVVIQSTNSMLARLLEMINGEFRISWRSFRDMQTYAVVLEIRSSLIAAPDARWSFFQAPLIVEDALGRKFPVPSEYNYELLNMIIKQKFRTGPGSLEIEAGNYEIFNTKNRRQPIRTDAALLPGTGITMAILVSAVTATSSDEVCPMSRCQSNKTTIAPGGGRIW